MIAGRYRIGGQLDKAVTRHRVFLDDDGVETVRHRRAGEDAHGLTGAQRPRKAPPSDAGADDLQHGAHGDIAAPQSIAIHGRRAKRRLIARGDYRHGQHAADSLRQGHGLDAKRRHTGPHQACRFAQIEIPKAHFSVSRGISSTMLQGPWRLSSCQRMTLSQPSLTAPFEPGRQKMKTPSMIPAKARDCKVDRPTVW